MTTNEPTSGGATRGTCQICGRSIALRDGLIRHHGHRVGGGGFRISQRGCRGGHRRPLEESTAAIADEIARLEEAVAKTKATHGERLGETKTWQERRAIRELRARLEDR